LPAKISNLINLQYLNLQNNKLTSLPYEILQIKIIIKIDETSYDINNLDNDNEILIFSDLSSEIMNLPINTKEIWLKKKIEKVNIKAPFGCILHYF
jgi:Leucine-rich repeat (LRR) protein